MNIYLDSNIILSQYIEKDQYKGRNQLLLEQTDLNFVTGFISVIEIKALIHRFWKNGQIDIDKEFKSKLKPYSNSMQVQRVFEYCIKKTPCQIISLYLPEYIEVLETEFETDIHSSLALRLGSVLDLKALDLIQIANAMNIKLYGKFAIDYFLTNDKLIITNGNTIRRVTKMNAVSSDDLINMLKINS